MRRAGKVDLIQAETVRLLRQIGASVQVLSGVGQGVPDLLCGFRGINVLLELKTGTAALTEDEARWHAKWAGQVRIVRTAEDAQVALIRAAMAAGV